jgi:hypothetical protein
VVALQLARLLQLSLLSRETLFVVCQAQDSTLLQAQLMHMRGTSAVAAARVCRLQ